MYKHVSRAPAFLLWVALCAIAQPASGQSAPSAYTTGYRYDVAGRLVGEIRPDADGSGPLQFAAIRYTYSATSGLLTKIEKGQLSSWQSEAVAPASWPGFTVYSVEQRSYDTFGHLAATALSSAGTTYALTQRNYDSYEFPQCTAVRMNSGAFPTMPTNEFQALPTDACSLGAAGSYGPDRITRITSDVYGHPLTVQKAYGTPAQITDAQYTYTPTFQISTVTDANGNLAKYTYDARDRRDHWYFPSPTTAGQYNANDYEQYGYDLSGNQTSLRKRDGRMLTFTYDPLNRVKSKCVTTTTCTAPNATIGRDVYYTYDLLGHQLSADFDSATGPDGVTNGYDGFGNVTSSTITMGTFTKSICSVTQPCLFDANGNRTQITHPDGQVFTYAYDGLDRLSGIYEGFGTATALDTFTFNADQTLASRMEGASGSPTATAAYTWDGIGRLTGQSDAFPSGSSGNIDWAFTLNPGSQITTEARSNSSYAYGGLVNVNRNYAVNGLNQYTSAGAAAFSYDANGNLIGDGTNNYVYDAENRLVSATTNGVTTTVIYDPLGRLFEVAKASADTKFLYDGDALIAEFNGTGTLNSRYVHGVATSDDPYVWYQNGTTRRYLHADHLGSIVGITNGTSTPSINSYDEYGIPGSGNSGRFQFTGQAWVAELGMYYYKARMYSATLGRFMQTDPVGYKGGINIYEYAADDPMDNNDPTGLLKCDAGAAARAGISCSSFDDAQSRVANQVHSFRASLQHLGNAIRNGAQLNRADRSTAARLDKYMGAGTGHNYGKIAYVNNVLANAERELRSTTSIATFDPKQDAAGNSELGRVVFNSMPDANTILHESVHFGTAAIRGDGRVAPVFDGGNVGRYGGYGSLNSALDRARYGWNYTSESAASYAWTVTGP